MINRLRCASIVAALAFCAVPAEAAVYSLTPGSPAIGALGLYEARSQDTLLDVARRYDLGFIQLMIANPGADAWLPRDGSRVALPSFYILPDAPRRGIVINLAEHRLFYYPPRGGRVETYPIGIGVQGRSTPIGTTRVVSKEPNPVWYPPPSIRAEKPYLPAFIGPGPDDPLGAFALHLGWSGYLIHGTNLPDGVGRNTSHGCIRMYPEDIDRLFHEVTVGTPVTVVDQETAVAWLGGGLYVDAFPDKSQGDEIELQEHFTPAMPQDLIPRVTAAATARAACIDWNAVRQAGLERTGMPVLVSRPADPDSGPCPGPEEEAEIENSP